VGSPTKLRSVKNEKHTSPGRRRHPANHSPGHLVGIGAAKKVPRLASKCRRCPAEAGAKVNAAEFSDSNGLQRRDSL
jgi:hypothetical protein